MAVVDDAGLTDRRRPRDREVLAVNLRGVLLRCRVLAPRRSPARAGCRRRRLARRSHGGISRRALRSVQGWDRHEGSALADKQATVTGQHGRARRDRGPAARHRAAGRCGRRRDDPVRRLASAVGSSSRTCRVEHAKFVTGATLDIERWVPGDPADGRLHRVDYAGPPRPARRRRPPRGARTVTGMTASGRHGEQPGQRDLARCRAVLRRPEIAGSSATWRVGKNGTKRRLVLPAEKRSCSRSRISCASPGARWPARPAPDRSVAHAG